MMGRIGLVLVCLLAACSPSQDEGRATTSVPPDAPLRSTVPSAGPENGPTDSAPPGPAGTSPGGPVDPPVTTDAPPATATTAPASGGGARPPAPGAVGSFGRYYLATAGAAELLVDLRVQGGVSADAMAIQRLRDVLARESVKRVTMASGTVVSDATSWSADAIRAEADRGRPSTGDGTGTLTVLYLAGGFADSDTSLGVAVRSDVAAIFPDRIAEAAGLFGNPTRIETGVVVHELGHLLGLVDLLLDTGRADPEHPGHSPNRDSVMYYAVESTLVGDLLADGPPTEFDAADRRDLATIAGR